ncbi:class I SAM-dependent methyltransferase [Candidatus Woesearchaeota archaeon]|nr:class I SAM-dependent methyltransferase [Candidatus Woesearchaeota archaeon]
MDPGLPFLAHYLSSGNGRITVLDLPGSYGGHGLRCPRGVKNQMDVWGMQSALGSYFFVEGDILLPPMSDSSFDVITEHNTLSWVTGWSLRSLSDVIKNYFRLLKEGGKALLFYQCFGKLNEESMLGQAQETGFKVSQVRNLIDKYPLDDQIAKDYSLYEKDMVTLDGAVSPFYPCKYLIVLEKPKHPDSQHLQHALR